MLGLFALASLFRLDGIGKDKTVTVPRRIVDRVGCEGSVRTIVSRCSGLGQHKGGLINLYPFRDRGAPSFAICPRGNSFCYFNYNINKSMVAFADLVRGLSCVRSIGLLTREDGVRLPRSNCSDSVRGVGGAICSVGHRSTGFFRDCLVDSGNG